MREHCWHPQGGSVRSLSLNFSSINLVCITPSLNQYLKVLYEKKTCSNPIAVLQKCARYQIKIYIIGQLQLKESQLDLILV